MNRSTGGLLAAAVLVLLGWLAVGALGGGDSQTPDVAAQTSPLTGVCKALTEARAGDAESSRAVFFDEAHDGLHDLASRTAEMDRTVAAELLRAKERVEALMDAGSPSDLRPALDDLAEVTATATQTLDPEAQSACP